MLAKALRFLFTGLAAVRTRLVRFVPSSDVRLIRPWPLLRGEWSEESPEHMKTRHPHSIRRETRWQSQKYVCIDRQSRKNNWTYIRDT